jgi:cytoskeletal protein CcmA (bactofilin family)
MGRLVARTWAGLLTGPGMDPSLPATEITALLGRGTQFEGKLHFEGRVRVDGIFKGEIKSDDTLVIGEGAEVHAEIDVSTVIVRGGQVHGNIRAKHAIEIHAPGKVIGNIHSPSVFIDRGVEFQGSCRMDDVDAPDPKTAPAKSKDATAQPEA